MTVYKVGEPDTTPDYGPHCGDVDDGYVCTREVRHGGNHAAGNGEQIASVWGSTAERRQAHAEKIAADTLAKHRANYGNAGWNCDCGHRYGQPASPAHVIEQHRLEAAALAGMEAA
jgi:hypothetical protein